MYNKEKVVELNQITDEMNFIKDVVNESALHKEKEINFLEKMALNEIDLKSDFDIDISNMPDLNMDELSNMNLRGLDDEFSLKMKEAENDLRMIILDSHQVKKELEVLNSDDIFISKNNKEKIKSFEDKNTELQQLNQLNPKIELGPFGDFVNTLKSYKNLANEGFMIDDFSKLKESTTRLKNHINDELTMNNKKEFFNEMYKDISDTLREIELTENIQIGLIDDADIYILEELEISNQLENDLKLDKDLEIDDDFNIKM